MPWHYEGGYYDYADEPYCPPKKEVVEWPRYAPARERGWCPELCYLITVALPRGHWNWSETQDLLLTLESDTRVYAPPMCAAETSARVFSMAFELEDTLRDAEKHSVDWKSIALRFADSEEIDADWYKNHRQERAVAHIKHAVEQAKGNEAEAEAARVKAELEEQARIELSPFFALKGKFSKG